MIKLKRGIYNVETLDACYKLKPVTAEDAAAIDKAAEIEIEVEIDDAGRVWNSGGQYVADVEEIE
jgi:hypothetical protein